MSSQDLNVRISVVAKSKQEDGWLLSSMIDSGGDQVNGNSRMVSPNYIQRDGVVFGPKQATKDGYLKWGYSSLPCSRPGGLSKKTTVDCLDSIRPGISGEKKIEDTESQDMARSHAS